ncbi:MAG: HAD-IA family hydrolase [Armatimonadetes bacterium]|nr:HAD-IA family hydrolase [Armatimonadota bacterium]
MDVNWQPEQVALEAAFQAGLKLDQQVAGEQYMRLLGSRWADYLQRNLGGDQSKTDAFWEEITEDWLTGLGQSTSIRDEIISHANKILFGTNSQVFVLYSDTVSALEKLNSMGIPLCVISNWDISLFRALEMHNLAKHFEFALASHVEGFEKPDPRLFQHASDKLGLEPREILHIGDNPRDDVAGARDFGMKALLLDRSAEESSGHTIRSLTEIPALLDTL